MTQPFSGNPCKCICKEGLRQGHRHCISCIAGLLAFEIIIYLSFHILDCLWLYNAGGPGFGASALAHPCSRITICAQIIYNGYQCSASYRCRHSGIPLPSFNSSANSVLFHIMLFPIILIVNIFCWLVCCSDSTY